ncbi:hypothetical protein Tco_1237991 [Tanacetum coccineum]
MVNSKRGSILMQDKLRLSKSQGASTPAELKRMQNVPYASAMGSIMYAVRCTRSDVAFAQNITSVSTEIQFMEVIENGTLRFPCLQCCWISGRMLLTSCLRLGMCFVLEWRCVGLEGVPSKALFATSSEKLSILAAFGDASKEALMKLESLKVLDISMQSSLPCESIEFGDIKLEKVHTAGQT